MLIQIFLQLSINVRLSSQCAPQKEANAKQAEGEDVPPTPLKLAPHGAVYFPGPVTGFTGGELDGLIIHLFVVAGSFGPGQPLTAQR